jgi:hypothetical protein
VAKGICSSCKFDPVCGYEADLQESAIECEQFEPGFPRAMPGERRNAASSFEGQGSGPYLGLCASCANRDSCIYSKPEGGVWRCEEYA